MAEGLLVDDKGRIWPEHSWDLARRLRFCHPSFDLATFAVLKHGFIHVRPQEGATRVALRSGSFGLAALGGALYEVKARRSRRILLALYVDGHWHHEFLASVWELADRAEHLISGAPIPPRYPWIAAERDLYALNLPHFALVRPLVKLWETSRGELTNDLPRALGCAGLLNRIILARQIAGSSRLVCDHFGSSIRILRPCESLQAVGRDIDDIPDRRYGGWVAETYSAALATRSLKLESVRADIGTSEASIIRVRYDRLLMPWRRVNDMYVLSVSMRRELARVA